MVSPNLLLCYRTHPVYKIIMLVTLQQWIIIPYYRDELQLMC